MCVKLPFKHACTAIKWGVMPKCFTYVLRIIMYKQLCEILVLIALCVKFIRFGYYRLCVKFIRFGYYRICVKFIRFGYYRLCVKFMRFWYLSIKCRVHDILIQSIMCKVHEILVLIDYA